MKATINMPSHKMEATGIFKGFDNRMAATLYIEFLNAVTKVPVTRLRILGDLKNGNLYSIANMTLEDFYYITEVTEG